MRILFGIAIVVIWGGAKLFKLGVDSMSAWGNFVVKGEKPWDEKKK